jgi:hypothetical protein
MEHAKKYVLVDPQMYRPSMPEKSLSSLDHEIQSTLNSQLPDDEKAKLYVSALKRFKAYDKKPPPSKINIETELNDGLPPNQQYKAKKLLRLIKDNPDIDWSDKGELIYKQTKISKSHVADLFGDVLSTQRPVEGPVGWEAFDEGISEVPTALVKRRIQKRKRGRPKWII